jgi:membrane protein implicated in regulation of membrane protease activity
LSSGAPPTEDGAALGAGEHVDPEIVTWIWLAAGLLMMAVELMVPGLVLVFMGLAAVAVSILRFIGVVEGLPESFVLWMISSILLVATLRRAATKWFPSEKQRANVDDEERDAYGKEVTVLEEIGENHADGRIRYQGTSWPAISVKGTLPKGIRVRIVYRENLNWVVEPIDEELKALEPPREEKVPDRATVDETVV